MEIYTLGHSTRTMEEFLDILRRHQIKCIVDVRRFPKSSRHPWFNKENLEKVLKEKKIKYLWLGKELGGYRGPKDIEEVGHKPGKCIKGQAFYNYCLYTESKSFKKGLKRLIKLSQKDLSAIMCAEKLYFKCHRMIIALRLKEKGIEVKHL